MNFENNMGQYPTNNQMNGNNIPQPSYQNNLNRAPYNQQFSYGYPNSSYGNQFSYPMNTQMNQPVQPKVYCKAVTSEDEAKAAPIELDGSLHIFTHLNQGKIYTKQLELDGNAPLRTFVMITEADPTPTENSTIEKIDYVSKKEFDDLYSLYEDMDKELRGLSKDFDEYLFKATKSDKGTKK